MLKLLGPLALGVALSACACAAPRAARLAATDAEVAYRWGRSTLPCDADARPLAVIASDELRSAGEVPHACAPRDAGAGGAP